ncbi:MAG TPA: FeoA family protein [Polyangiaceae bacterium]|nr:FeoA family protein [Polyangiaceae bacterium]
MLTLDQVVPGTAVVVEKVGGARSFRRRLMELGIIPGTRVEVLRVAPFGDPLELSARGCNLSIRASEAQQVEVEGVGVGARQSVASEMPRSASWVPPAARNSQLPVARKSLVPAARNSRVPGIAKSSP